MEQCTFRDVELSEEPAPDDGIDGRAYVAVVGIDRYRAWSPLCNATNDARGALNLFTALGFEPICEPILDDAATGDALRRLVTDDLAVLGPRDSLVLFVAGHGHTVTRTYADGTHAKRGYLIPVDGERPGGQTSNWVRLDAWLSDVAHLSVRHLLVFLDACHSGIALDRVVRWRGKEPGFNAREQPLGQLRSRRSRRIVTSALDDEVAQDNGPIPGHSLFTGCLIEALTGGLLARTLNPLVTGTEIGRYVQRRVIDYPGSRQTPDFGALELDNRGELVVELLPMLEVAVEPPIDVTQKASPPPAPIVTRKAVTKPAVDILQKGSTLHVAGPMRKPSPVPAASVVREISFAAAGPVGPKAPPAPAAQQTSPETGGSRNAESVVSTALAVAASGSDSTRVRGEAVLKRRSMLIGVSPTSSTAARKVVPATTAGPPTNSRVADSRSRYDADRIVPDQRATLKKSLDEAIAAYVSLDASKR